MCKIVWTLLLLGVAVAANVTVPSKGSDLKITIYNNDLAFVEDKRETQVAKGEQRLVYEGVPASVITQSVVPAFSGVPARLFSQNYIYDLISLDSMLQKSVNHEVMFMTNGKDPRRSRGVLLSVRPTVMVKELRSEKIYSLESPTQVIFSKIPENMITKPSLVWHIMSERAGKLGIDLKYLTRGITWKSDYVLNLEKKWFDLTGWITVDNRSGVAYENARITCLAGELHMAQQERYRGRALTKAMPAPMAEEVREEAFAGYHIYKIPFRETISNKQQKQILFLQKNRVPCHQYGKCVNSYFENYGEQKLRFAHKITFLNSKKSGMGVPLPAGTVRMYQKDSGGETHFIGEDRIKNVPAEERVTLTVGTLFDATGEKRITRFVATKHHREVETTYDVRNRGKAPLELRIEERVPVYGQDISLKTSCKGVCSVAKKNAFVREFTIRLKAKGSYRFTSEFSVDF